MPAPSDTPGGSPGLSSGRDRTVPRRAVVGALAVLVAASGAFAIRIALGEAPQRPSPRAAGAPPAAPTAWVQLAPDETPAPSASPNVPTRGTGQPLQFWHAFGADTGAEPTAHAAIWNAYSAATQTPIRATAVPSTPFGNLPIALADALAAGTPPDAVCLDRLSLPAALTDHLITDLTAYVGHDGVQPSAYYPHVWDDVRLANRLMAAPFGADARGLWWRRAYLAGQNIDPDTGPPTLQALTPLAVGAATTPQGGRQWGFSPYVGDTHPYTWGIPYGARWFDPSTQQMTAAAVANVDALTWYAARLKSGLPPSAPGGPSPLLTGEVQALVDGHWLLAGLAPAQQAMYGAAPLPPAGAAAVTTTWSSGYGIAVPPGVKQPERSWTLASYYAGPSAALAYLGAGGRRVMPTQPSLAAHPTVQAPGKLWQTFLALLPAAWARPVMAEAAFAWTALADASERIRRAEATPERALQAVDAAVNGALARDRQ